MSAPSTGRLTRDGLNALVASGEIDTIILAIADMQGRLQGKRLDAQYFIDDLDAGDVEGCSYLLASDVDMNTIDGFALTSWERGYGDMVFAPDLASTRLVPWHDRTPRSSSPTSRPSTARRVDVSPRAKSSSARQRDSPNAAGMDLRATELEFIVFDDTYEDAWHQGYRNLSPAQPLQRRLLAPGHVTTRATARTYPPVDAPRRHGR